MGKDCLNSGKSQSLYTFTRFIRSFIKQIVVTAKMYHCYQLHTKFYTALFCQGYMWTNLLWSISVGSKVTDQLLIIYFAFFIY